LTTSVIITFASYRFPNTMFTSISRIAAAAGCSLLLLVGQPMTAEGSPTPQPTPNPTPSPKPTAPPPTGKPTGSPTTGLPTKMLITPAPTPAPVAKKGAWPVWGGSSAKSAKSSGGGWKTGGSAKSAKSTWAGMGSSAKSAKSSWGGWMGTGSSAKSSKSSKLGSGKPSSDSKKWVCGWSDGGNSGSGGNGWYKPALAPLLDNVNPETTKLLVTFFNELLSEVESPGDDRRALEGKKEEAHDPAVLLLDAFDQLGVEVPAELLQALEGAAASGDKHLRGQ